MCLKLSGGQSSVTPTPLTELLASEHWGLRVCFLSTLFPFFYLAHFSPGLLLTAP